jgi:hypothetical protein
MENGGHYKHVPNSDIRPRFFKALFKKKKSVFNELRQIIVFLKIFAPYNLVNISRDSKHNIYICPTVAVKKAITLR